MFAKSIHYEKVYFTFVWMSDLGYCTARLARHFECSTRTVERRLKTYGLSIRRIRYSFISDDDLTEIITNIINEGDELGNLFNVSNTAHYIFNL
jgi:AraC-like DNA-binding protein